MNETSSDSFQRQPRTRTRLNSPFFPKDPSCSVSAGFQGLLVPCCKPCAGQHGWARRTPVLICQALPQQFTGHTHPTPHEPGPFARDTGDASDFNCALRLPVPKTWFKLTAHTLPGLLLHPKAHSQGSLLVHSSRLLSPVLNETSGLLHRWASHNIGFRVNFFFFFLDSNVYEFQGPWMEEDDTKQVVISRKSLVGYSHYSESILTFKSFLS